MWSAQIYGLERLLALDEIVTKAGERLIQEITTSFGITPGFAQAYIEANSPGFDLEMSVAEWLGTFNDLSQHYINYALTSNQRAETVKTNFEAAVGLRPGRHLDVGCGYGGTLRAFAAAGSDCVGVEIVPQLAAYSRANTEGLGIPIFQESFIDIDASRLGSFKLDHLQ